MLNMILQFKFICNPKKLWSWLHSWLRYYLLDTWHKDFFLNYFLKKKSIHNKFKWKILDNSNYANFQGGGDFSYAYVIIINILVKNQKCKNE
jgi:hypothetical protein